MRYLILPLLLLAVLLPTIILPQQGDLMPSALEQNAPSTINTWKGISFRETEEERNTLARDTIFVKKFYVRPAPNSAEQYHRLTCSLIFSGHDVNSSIHQPEICLPAQGHFDMVRSPRELELPARKRTLPIQRIHSKQLLNPLAGRNSSVMNSLTYYFFVGHSAITNEHQERTVLDIKDRLFKGYDQRWAFLMISMPFGEHPDDRIETLSESEADEILSQFCTDLAERSINWEMIAD